MSLRGTVPKTKVRTMNECSGKSHVGCLGFAHEFMGNVGNVIRKRSFQEYDYRERYDYKNKNIIMIIRM